MDAQQFELRRAVDGLQCASRYWAGDHQLYNTDFGAVLLRRHRYPARNLFHRTVCHGRRSRAYYLGDDGPRLRRNRFCGLSNSAQTRGERDIRSALQNEQERPLSSGFLLSEARAPPFVTVCGASGREADFAWPFGKMGSTRRRVCRPERFTPTGRRSSSGRLRRPKGVERRASLDGLWGEVLTPPRPPPSGAAAAPASARGRRRSRRRRLRHRAPADRS